MANNNPSPASTWSTALAVLCFALFIGASGGSSASGATAATQSSTTSDVTAANATSPYTELISGVPLSGTVGPSQSSDYYIQVPRDATDLTITAPTSNGSVFIQSKAPGSRPPWPDFCDPAARPSKSCSVGNPAKGTWLIGVINRSNSSNSSYTITATVTFSIVGNASMSGVTVTAGSQSATSDASGNYAINGVAAGSYTVTPSKSGCAFSPNWTTASAPPYGPSASFTGWCGPQLTSGVAMNGQSVAAGGQAKYYSLNVPTGTANLTIALTGATGNASMDAQFSTGQQWTNGGCNATTRNGSASCLVTNPATGTWWVKVQGAPAASNFTITGTTSFPTYSISGRVGPSGRVGTSGVTVTAGSASATTDANGNYSINGLAAGTYTVTPSRSGCVFSPASASVPITSANATTSFSAICGTQLTNGVPISAVVNENRQQIWKYYYITVPSGATNVTFNANSAPGAVNIYTQVDQPPVWGQFNCTTNHAHGRRSRNAVCSMDTPTAGTWWVAVEGYSFKGTDFKISGTVTMPRQ